MTATELRTERLLLRGWRPEDRAPFAALNADPEVMRWFPAPLDRAASDALADRAGAEVAAQGWGKWAVEVVHGDPAGFIGYVGLAVPDFPGPFGDAPEVGWRLARGAWGRGYAPEAAAAVLDHAFGPLGFPEVVSFTTEGNAKSRRVMEKLGLVEDPDGAFDHPRTPGWWGARHVLYRTTAERWWARRGRPPTG